MEGALKGLFGGGEQGNTQAHDFIQRVTTGDPTQGYSTDEAHAAVDHVVKNAPPETINRAMQKSLGSLNEEQRSQFAQMLEQRAARGRSGDGGGPTIQHTGGTTQGGGGGMGDILGGLLGGGGFSDLLGGLLGGGGGDSNATNRDDGMLGGLGDIMNNPIGRAAMAGMAAYAMKELLDR
jgi:hypothetical protein